MIDIIKEKEKIRCSRKTYEEQYKQLGYTPVIEKKEKVISSVDSKVENQRLNEDDKISAKYGVRKRTTSKKEDE